MYRTRSYRRHQRRRIIDWKKKFIKLSGCWYYKHEGELDKGKIHCSCWMCRYRGELLNKRNNILKIDMEEQIKYIEEYTNE